jgi:elongation factor G
MKGVVWDEETLGAKYHDVDIPLTWSSRRRNIARKLIEAAVDLDDDAMTGYLEGGAR